MAIYKKPIFKINQENKISIQKIIEDNRRYFISEKNTVLHIIWKNKIDNFSIQAKIYDNDKNHYSDAVFSIHKKTGQVNYYLAKQQYKQESDFLSNLWDFEGHFRNFLNNIIITK